MTDTIAHADTERPELPPWLNPAFITDDMWRARDRAAEIADKVNRWTRELAYDLVELRTWFDFVADCDLDEHVVETVEHVIGTSAVFSAISQMGEACDIFRMPVEQVERLAEEIITGKVVLP